MSVEHVPYAVTEGCEAMGLGPSLQVYDEQYWMEYRGTLSEQHSNSNGGMDDPYSKIPHKVNRIPLT